MERARSFVRNKARCKECFVFKEPFEGDPSRYWICRLHVNLFQSSISWRQWLKIKFFPTLKLLFLSLALPPLLLDRKWSIARFEHLHENVTRVPRAFRHQLLYNALNSVRKFSKVSLGSDFDSFTVVQSL